jgi:predicted small lipoprotein YifL
MRRLLLCLFVLATGGACGQKGPLYLSDNPPPGARPSAIKAYKPVPYPEHGASETQSAPEAEK